MGIKCKAAIVGCGKIGASEIFSHALAYTQNPKTRLIAAADVNRKRLEAFKRIWRIERLYNDYALMIERERPDIVSICTPSDGHYNVLKEAVKGGVRVIWCEKPICDEIKDARKIVCACRKNKIVLAVNYYRRGSAPHRMVKGFIDKNKLGPIQRIICCYSKGLLNNASHLIDLMHFYFGEIAWVRTAPEPVLGFKKGFTAALYSFDDSHFRIIEMDIIGAKGRIRLKDAERVMEYYKTGRHPWVKDLKALKPQKTFKYGIDLLQPIRAVLTDIVDCIENKKKPLCSGEDGLMALAVVKAIEESYRRNGAKINVRYV